MPAPQLQQALAMQALAAMAYVPQHQNLSEVLRQGQGQGLPRGCWITYWM